MGAAKEHLGGLAYLRLLLHCLPDSLLFCDSRRKTGVTDLGGENSAVNQVLETNFWDRSRINRVEPIKGRGPGILAILDVLCRCLLVDQSDERPVLWLGEPYPLECGGGCIILQEQK